MIRKPEELIRPIQEAVNRKAVMFSHILLALTVTIHTILDPRSFGYQIGIAIGISVLTTLLAYLRFFDLASVNNRPKLYVATYYLVSSLGFAFVSDPATPYITGFFMVAIFSNLYYGDRGLKLLLIVLTLISAVKYVFLMATTDVTTLDQLNIVATLLVFIAVISIYMNVQKVYDWDYARLKVALKDSDLEQKRLSTLINNMTEGVLVLTKDGVISMYNAATLNLFDTNRPLTGQMPEEFIALEDRNGKPVKTTQLLTGTSQPISRDDIILRYGERDTASLSITVTPLKTSYGQTNEDNGYIMTVRDITREKSLEEERDEFISVISHELRTPVTVTEASLSNALLINNKQNGSEDIAKSLNVAHDQAMYLASILNDLSTFARAEQNDLDLNLEEINPMTLVNQIRDDYKAQAEGKGLRINSIVDDDAAPAIISSRLYVREILQNLVTNAIKYSDSGEITIRAAAANNAVRFSVTDQGIGISKSDQDKVFDKFFRTEDFRTRSTGGTGLGLYIARKLAKLIHAEFGLESEVGKGSTFSLTVPDLHDLQTRRANEPITEPVPTASTEKPTPA